MTLPQRHNGLSARRLAVLETLREPSLGRPVSRQFLRNAVLDFTSVVPATAYPSRSYAERYSRFTIGKPTRLDGYSIRSCSGGYKFEGGILRECLPTVYASGQMHRRQERPVCS